MPGSTREILLVEDEEAHTELLRRAFEDDGDCCVTIVSTLSGARAKLSDKAHTFDVVITDLRLPDGSGTALLEPDRGNEPPVVIMTSQGDERAAVEAMKAGAIDYVVKSDTAFRDMPRTAARAVRESQLVAEKRHLTEKLLEKERLAAVGTAAAMLAHEIGNPLNSMHLHATLLQRHLGKLEVSESVQDSLNSCLADIRRLNNLLIEFRGLSRQQLLSTAPTDVAGLIQKVLAAQAPMLGEAQVQANTEVAEGLPEVDLDSAKLTQVLVNLIKNAAEAMYGGGALTVLVEPCKLGVAINIIDTGCGLPDSIDIFQPFQTTKPHGTGLWLPVVKQIVEAHEGQLSASNNTDGPGACFTIELPLKRQPPNAIS